MQRRIFRIDGTPFIAVRDGGFIETHGTLAALIEKHRPGAPDRIAEAEAVPIPAQTEPSEPEASAVVPVAPEAVDGQRRETDPPPAKRRRARTPRPETPPASTEAAPTDAAEDKPNVAEEVLGAVEVVQNSGPRARVVGRRRAGQPPTPRWMTAGKARRGRLK